jgi:hypothetical protein
MFVLVACGHKYLIEQEHQQHQQKIKAELVL